MKAESLSSGGGGGVSAGAARIDAALACFALLAKFLGVPADPQQIAHDRGKGDEPYSLEDLSRIAKKLGLVARIKTASLADLKKLPLPAIVQCYDGAVILLKMEADTDDPRMLTQRGDGERSDHSRRFVRMMTAKG